MTSTVPASIGIDGVPHFDVAVSDEFVYVWPASGCPFPDLVRPDIDIPVTVDNNAKQQHLCKFSARSALTCGMMTIGFSSTSGMRS